MSALRLLFRDTFRRDSVRLGCALLGIMAAAALLMWSIGLAETSWGQCRALSESMARPFDCWVSTGRASAAAPKGTGMQSLQHGSPVKMIPETVVEAVKASPDVASVQTTAVFRCRLDWRPEGRPLQGPGIGGGLCSVRDFPTCPYPEGLACGRWPNADALEPEFVISPRAFGEDGLKAAPPIGTKVPVITPVGNIQARICGYLSEDIRPVSGFPTLFASAQLADAAALAEVEGRCNLMLIQLRPNTSPDVLAELVRTISPDDDAAALTTRQGLLRQLRSDATNNLLFQLPLLVALACVCTLCMIVNALCIGIEQNRIRYARLRALGMTVGQLLALVTREGVALTLLGGIVGGIVGWGCLALFVTTKPMAFPDGLLVSGITVGAVAALLFISLGFALILPLRRVRHLKPYELRVAPSLWQTPHPLRRTLFALGCLLPILLTLVRFTANPMMRSGWFLCVGLPLAVTGLLFIVKPLLRLTETLLSPIIAYTFRLKSSLLRGVLTRATDRNAHMVITLTAGLGAFFAIHIWGASLTKPFIPSKDLPPAIITLLPNGISEEALAHYPKLPSDVRPFSAEQYRLHEADYQAIATRTGALPKQNNILLIATRGDQGVTVTEMFARQCQLAIGDTLRIQRADRDGTIHTLPLTITAIVRCNWHLVSARAQLRARNGAPMGTLGPIFVGEEVAKAWDPEKNERIRFLWLDALPPAQSTDELYSATDLLELRLQQFAEQDPQPYLELPRFSRSAVKGGTIENVQRPPMKPAFPNVVIRIRDEISEGTISRSAELLGAMARIPLWSLLILCTGFISLLTANVRAMADELRTYHAIGMTRGQMGRFLFSQAVMLAVSAIVLSLLLGLTIGWGFTGCTLAWMPFGGLPTTLVLPWGTLLQGVGLLLLAVLIITPLPIALLLRKVL